MKRTPSGQRLQAIMLKEFIQMRRDRMTFGMVVGIPILQLILFGYAINMDPKHLPTAVVAADQSPMARAVVAAAHNTGYFRILDEDFTEASAARALRRGEAQFVLSIPVDFGRKVLRGEQPSVLLEADATDPASIGNAVAALNGVIPHALYRDLSGPLHGLQPGPAPASLIVHRAYNPEIITQYNIVPGLLGVILTMMMVFITSLAMTRERERGTMETLLSTPVRPLEVMVGKIVPYVLVGYVQCLLILTGAKLLFGVPMLGSIPLLLGCTLFFIAATLVVGITFSTVARNQLQAIQMSIFFFLPSILLSGFMFPFRGMPLWAQVIGNILPLTHFLPIVRGILLKGNGLPDFLPHMGALILFTLVVLAIGLKRYRKTLD